MFLKQLIEPVANRLLAGAEMLVWTAPARRGPSSAAAVQSPRGILQASNGLRVVLSPDHNIADDCVGVLRIGFRGIEPKRPHGFAHLFEQ